MGTRDCPGPPVTCSQKLKTLSIKFRGLLNREGGGEGRGGRQRGDVSLPQVEVVEVQMFEIAG